MHRETTARRLPLGRWRSTRVSKTVAFLALASIAPAMAIDAADPEQTDLPSYLLEPPLTIAALVQGDGKSPLPGDDATVEPRDALDILAAGDDEAADDVDGPDGQVTNRTLFSDRQTKIADGKFALPPISALTTSTAEIGNGEVPLGFREGENSPAVLLPEAGNDRGLPWQWNARHWAAANTFSHPLYFEDRMLERHGHQRYPYLQPIVSGGRFFAQAVTLPYLGAISPPSECHYSLGYYRAGSCVPVLKQRPPYQRKAAAAQAAAVVAGVVIFP